MRNYRLKSCGRNIFEYLSDKRERIVNLYKKATMVKRKCLVKLRIFWNRNSVPNPEIIYWIDPRKIIYHTNYIRNNRYSDPKDRVFSHIDDLGKVYSGDWDLSDYKFSDLEIYKAFEERINFGVKWEDTKFFEETLQEIETGIFRWGCKKKKDLEKRSIYLDNLIESFRNRGFKLNSEVFIDGDDVKSLEKGQDLCDEINVNIGRDGRYLFQDGRHRLSIAKILELDRVAVKVLVRHKKWHELRIFLLQLAAKNVRANQKGMLEQPALHPDLVDIPAARDCEDRFFAIRPHVTGAPGTLLDIAANLGYFCHKFDDMGYNCYAIELREDVAWAAKQIRDAEGKSFKVITGDLFDTFDATSLCDMNFDIVIAFNVFQDFLKTEKKFVQLKGWLQKLQTEVMFFESHRFDEPQMQGAYMNFREDDFVDFLLKHSVLNRAYFIHKTKDGRKIFKLFKEQDGFARKPH